jgi:hypothetical protein
MVVHDISAADAGDGWVISTTVCEMTSKSPVEGQTYGLSSAFPVAELLGIAQSHRTQ